VDELVAGTNVDGNDSIIFNGFCTLRHTALPHKSVENDQITRLLELKIKRLSLKIMAISLSV
jgi:hypothetical protein